MSKIAHPPDTGARPPCVLQILPALESGGVERGTVDIAAALVKAGWRAIVASSGGRMVAELDYLGARHITLPLHSKNPVTIYRNIQRLTDLIHEERVDIMHARSRAPAWSGYYAAQGTGIPFVTTFHAAYNGHSRVKHRYNGIMGRGDRVIAISDFVGDYARTIHGVEPARLRVIPRGIDLTRFNPDLVTASRIIELAGTWRLEDGAPLIMLPGRITRWKGHFVLLDAIAALGRRDLQVVFVGSDTQKKHLLSEIKQKVESLGLEGMIKIVGDCRDMPAAYMLADVVVSASVEPEGFGRVAVEAQAMGRPVIATHHGGAAETVKDGVTGLLIPPNDPESLADALDSALSLSLEERAELKTNARTWVAETFDLALMSARTLSVYRELLSPTARTALRAG